jgi:ammonium transporter, Amt family
VNHFGAPVLSDAAAVLVAAAILLIPLAIAGIAIINTGLGRSRNAAHLMMASLLIAGVAAVAYVFCGFSWQGLPAGPGRLITVAGKDWNWIAHETLLLQGIDLASPQSLVIWMQILAASLAGLIPAGGAAERWRLGAICVSTALLSGITYPLFAHWAWGGGWLAQLGNNFRLGYGFVDIGGAGVIHTTGGLTALAMVWILGPRRGKYTSEGLPTAIPAHHAVFVIFGCLLAWAGWMGINTAGALLLFGLDSRRVGLIGINTTLAAGSSALMTAIVTRLRFGRPDASLTANGWVAGLVAGSAACALVPPAAAIVIGLVAGFLAPIAIENLEARLSIDDPAGAISVHAIGGIWGLIATGMFARFPTEAFADRGSSDVGQWVAQLVGVATLLGFVLPLAYALNWLLNLVLPQRVAAEGERQGLDLHELGAGAYPDFPTHSEDFLQR